MFANFANLMVFVNIFLLNFHFLVLFTAAQRWRSSRLTDFCKHSSANQMGAGSKFSRHNHTRAKHSTSEWRDWAIANGCVQYSYCIGAYCFVGLLQWKTVGKMGVASDDIGNCTIYSQRAITICERFLVNYKKINKSRTFSFADYSRYTVINWQTVEYELAIHFW